MKRRPIPGDLVVVYSVDGFPVTKPCLLVKIVKVKDEYAQTAYHTLTQGKIEIWETAFWRVEKHEGRRSSPDKT